MDVAEWLRGLGLDQYTPAFRDNDIDGEVLRRLTAEDLRDLGITSIGHRRRLLDAIAALAAGDAPPASPAPAPAGPPAAEAERRQLTVMFCDLVGSTPLASRFDPEDLRDIVGAYHRCVSETVARFGGFVAKYMGDGVLVYFGYPRAHEDDAERAARAGLAVVDGLRGPDQPPDLAVRIGVASGLVVVGDLIGEGAAQERGVVGETPNLAARLQGIAQPNWVVIAEATRRQIGTLFELAELGPQPLAGFAAPLPAWRVLRESDEVSRFAALRSAETPLVGRDEELDLLLRRWQQARTGEGRVVLISGEPGIGKSRLTAALAERLADKPHTRLRWFCSPHHQESALYPTIAGLERAAGFTRDDTAEQRLARARALLSSAGTPADEFELLAELLALPNAVAALNISPQRKREKLFESLLRQLSSLAQREPVLGIFEDVHWIDPTSRELLDLIVERVRSLPVLVVVTFRPEFQAPWGGQPHVTSLALNRLGGREVASLVLGLAGNAPLGGEVVAEIAERTDGVPLFIEELTKAVIERADQENRVKAVLSASPLPALAVPETLHASLIARLDRIGPAASEVAQIGSVLGREFAYELIEHVALRPDLNMALVQLTEAGLLFCRGVPPHSSYMFKHALVQDAAYGTLLRARRQGLHARVAAVLEEHFPDLVERQPELLAHHLTGAARRERSVDQWLKAGQSAAKRMAHLEAIRHFERGLAELAKLPDGRERERREIELQLARGLSFFTVAGFTAPKAADSYERARELAERSGNAQQRFMASYGLWQSANGTGDIYGCRKLAQGLRLLTADHPDDGLRLQALHSAWATALFSGDVAAAHAHAEAGRHLYDPERHRSHRQQYGGHDPGACARYLGGQAQWSLGHADRALALGRDALALAQQIAHPFSLVISLQYIAMIHLDRGEPETALERVSVAEALAAEQRLGFAVEPLLIRGGALAALRQFEEAAARLRAGLARPGANRNRGFGLAKLAEALSGLGRHAEALAAAREGLRGVEATGHAQWQAELHRFEALALRGINEPEDSERSLQAALEVCRRQGSKGHELRAATCLARLWDEQGRRQEAHELLAPVYGWFTEGFDTADLKEAAALLAEL